MTRQDHHEPGTAGDHIARIAAGFVGSWRFIIAMTVVVMAWVALNVLAFARHFDPYPFILLNLLFSTQAAYATPLILLAQNQAAKRDREIAARDDEEIGRLLELQEQQMAHLAAHAAELALLRRALGGEEGTA